MSVFVGVVFVINFEILEKNCVYIFCSYEWLKKILCGDSVLFNVLKMVMVV